MDRYLNELEELLIDLDSGDRCEAVEYYRNYIIEAHLDTYENIVNQLGSTVYLSNMIRKSQTQYYDEDIEISSKKVHSVKNEIQDTRGSQSVVTNNFLWCIVLGIIVVMFLNAFIGIGIFLCILYALYYFIVRNRRK
jgi:hypothetical protein